MRHDDDHGTALDELLAFWFAPGTKPRWFAKDGAFDAELRDRFGPLAAAAALAGQPAEIEPPDLMRLPWVTNDNVAKVLTALKVM